MGIPQKGCHQQTEKNDQKKADDRLKKCDSDVSYHMVVAKLFCQAEDHTAGTGEKETVNPAQGGACLPQGQKQ